MEAPQTAGMLVLAATVAIMLGCSAGSPETLNQPVGDLGSPGKPELRVIQYNIRSFEGYVNDKHWDRCNDAVRRGQMIERMALELELYDPDVICLEEVPSKADAARLAKRLGMHYVHFKGGWKSKGWPEGISGAVLSKYPIVEAQPHPSLNWTERPEKLFTRFWGRAVIDAPGGKIAIHGMHGSIYGSENRQAELAEVLPVIKNDVAAGMSVILLGDLNYTPDSPEYAQTAAAGMRDSFGGPSNQPELWTIPSTKRRQRIDYIWSAGPISKRLSSAKVLFEGAFRTNPDDPDSFALSDHVPVLAVFSAR